MAVEGRDSHLAPLRVAYFEHGAWLPRHVCIERAKQQEVKSESIRADFNRFVSGRILPIYAAWSIPRPLLVKVAQEETTGSATSDISPVPGESRSKPLCMNC